MTACRPAWVLGALLVGLILMLPATAGAFSAREEPLSLAYARDATPVVFATGLLEVEGRLAGGYLAADVGSLTLRKVPTLTVTERPGGALPRNETHRDVDVVVHGGTVLWTFGGGGALDVRLSSPYALGLALPRLPLGEAAGAGVMVVSPALSGDLAWRGAGDAARLLVLDAQVTLLDARGVALDGWQRRTVNAGLSPTSDPSLLDVLFHAEGAFSGTSDARIQGGALGASETLSLSASPAARDRFSETLDVLSSANEVLGAQAESTFGRGSPIRQLEPYSGVLNGALLVLGGTPGGDGGTVEPVESRVGDEPFDVSPMALVRGDPMTISWDDAQMRVQGTPVVALGGSGFAVEEPASVAGLVPVLSIVLWCVALGGAVVFFVKRPPKAEGGWTLRLVSLAVHLLVLAVVFWYWDASFAQTFGTSVLTLFGEGVAFSDPARLALVFALETAPWGIAALLFALPVRIALGVALRYLGKGRAYKGLAKAGGLAALGLLGPVYALWAMNTLVAKMFEYLPAMLG